MDFIRVLIQKAESKDAHGIGIGVELLNDEVVVFTGFDISTVLANGVTDGFILLFVFLFQGLDPGKFFGTALHGQLDKGIPGTGGGRRSEHLNSGGRQRRIDILPGLVGVGNQRFTPFGIRDVFGQRQKDVFS